MSGRHVVLAGAVAVAAPPDDALELFTPEGERGWAPGWEPAWVHGGEAPLAPGAVFRTVLHGEDTVWLVVDVDRAARRVRYVRDTPGSRIGTVEVCCAPAQGGGTSAQVTYALTALSPAGEAYLATFARDFPAMLASWQREIARARGG